MVIELAVAGSQDVMHVCMYWATAFARDVQLSCMPPPLDPVAITEASITGHPVSYNSVYWSGRNYNHILHSYTGGQASSKLKPPPPSVSVIPYSDLSPVFRVIPATDHAPLLTKGAWSLQNTPYLEL